MNKLYVRKYRKKHKEAGLCIECKEKAEVGYVRCRYHLDIQAESARRRRSK